MTTDAQPQDWNGPIWQLKVTKFFNLLDFNDNGLHDINDMQLMANEWSFGTTTASNVDTLLASLSSSLAQVVLQSRKCNVD